MPRASETVQRFVPRPLTPQQRTRIRWRGIEDKDFTAECPDSSAALCEEYSSEVTIDPPDPGGTYHYEVTDGALPDGLALGFTSGTVTGTPLEVGTFHFTITVTNVDTDRTAVIECTIVVSGIACPGITLVCDSITASKSKCGLTEFPGYASSPPKYYLQLDLSDVGTESDVSTTPGGGTEVCVGVGSLSATATVMYDPGSCEATCSPEGGYDYTQTDLGDCESFTCEHAAACSFGNDYIHHPPGGAHTGWVIDSLGFCYPAWPSANEVSRITSATSSDVHFFYSQDPAAINSWFGYTIDCEFTASLSNEYTTSLLIAETEADMPPYCGIYGCSSREDCDEAGQGCTCSATRSLDANELSYTIRRFRYKWIFSASPYDMTIYWTTRFAPAGGGSPTDTTYSTFVPAGATSTSVFTQDEPSTNGTTSIVNVSCEATCP